VLSRADSHSTMGMVTDTARFPDTCADVCGRNRDCKALTTTHANKPAKCGLRRSP